MSSRANPGDPFEREWGEKVQRAIGRAESRLRLCSGLGLSIDVDGRVDASPTLPFKLLLSLLESATLFESVL